MFAGEGGREGEDRGGEERRGGRVRGRVRGYVRGRERRRVRGTVREEGGRVRRRMCMYVYTHAIRCWWTCKNISLTAIRGVCVFCF